MIYLSHHLSSFYYFSVRCALSFYVILLGILLVKDDLYFIFFFFDFVAALALYYIYCLSNCLKLLIKPSGHIIIFFFVILCDIG